MTCTNPDCEDGHVSVADREELSKFEEWVRLVYSGMTQELAYAEVYGGLVFDDRDNTGNKLALAATEPKEKP